MPSDIADSITEKLCTMLPQIEEGGHRAMVHAGVQHMIDNLPEDLPATEYEALVIQYMQGLNAAASPPTKTNDPATLG